MSKKIGKTIQTTIFYVLIALFVLYIILQVVAPDFTIKVFRFKPYIVETGSMEPVINENDMVVVKNFKFENLEVGDIITFKADAINYDGIDEIVTHYIYSINTVDGEYYIRTIPYTDETIVREPDNWVLAEDDVLGLYSFHIPWIGTIARFIQTPFGIAAIIVNIGVIVGIVYINKKFPKEENEKQETETPQAKE